MSDQPLPTGDGASVTAEVRRMLDERALSGVDVEGLRRALDERERKGIESYKTTLKIFNGRDALRDLSEELLDAVQYATQERMERERLEARIAELECRASILREDNAELRRQVLAWQTGPGKQGRDEYAHNPVPAYAGPVPEPEMTRLDMGCD